MINRNILAAFFAVQMISQSGFTSSTQCRQVFNAPTSQQPHLEMAKAIKQSVDFLIQNFAANYQFINTKPRNIEFNDSVQNLVDLNNQVLNLIASVSLSTEIFNSAEKRILQKDLLATLTNIFSKQNIPDSEIQKIISSKFELIKEHNLPVKEKNQIGFIWTNENTSSENNITKKIGFLQKDILQNPYGKTPDPSQPSQAKFKNPIGFTTTTNLSIETINSAERAEVGYQLSLDFDYKNATFISVSNKKPIGFIH